MIDETMFPDSYAKYLEDKGEDIDNATTPIYISRIADVYMKSPTDRWFKRCIEDFEEYEYPDGHYMWFAKWFSQFTTKGDNNE